jgi:hypothetical protein
VICTVAARQAAVLYSGTTAHVDMVPIVSMQSKKGAELIYKYPILLDACANEMQVRYCPLRTCKMAAAP